MNEWNTSMVYDRTLLRNFIHDVDPQLEIRAEKINI